jgi:putative addiction module component (TIGR02574 family)
LVHPQALPLRSLTIAEKLQVIEDLWDDMEASGEPFPLPAWIREEADRRMAEIDADPSLALTPEEVWREVEKRRG